MIFLQGVKLWSVILALSHSLRASAPGAGATLEGTQGPLPAFYVCQAHSCF